MTFTQNFGLDSQTQKSFSHAWSLCVEEQFYLLLPITIFFVFRSRIQKFTPVLIIMLIGLGFFLRIYNWNEFVQPFIESGSRREMFKGFIEKVYYPSYNRMDGLIIGVTIAAIFTFKPKIKDYLTKYGNIVLIIGIGLFLFAYQICENLITYKAMIFGLPLISLAYGVILIGAISPTCILYKIKSRITLIIATLSYAIYLTYKQIYHFVKIILKEIDNGFIQQNVFWFCLLGALIGGLILHVLIEKPFMKLRDSVLNPADKKFQKTSGRLILNYIKTLGDRKART